MPLSERNNVFHVAAGCGLDNVISALCETLVETDAIKLLHQKRLELDTARRRGCASRYSVSASPIVEGFIRTLRALPSCCDCSCQGQSVKFSGLVVACVNCQSLHSLPDHEIARSLEHDGCSRMLQALCSLSPLELTCRITCSLHRTFCTGPGNVGP